MPYRHGYKNNQSFLFNIGGIWANRGLAKTDDRLDREAEAFLFDRRNLPEPRVRNQKTSPISVSFKN